MNLFEGPNLKNTFHSFGNPNSLFFIFNCQQYNCKKIQKKYLIYLGKTYNLKHNLNLIAGKGLMTPD